MSKPVKNRELLARIEAVSRRALASGTGETSNPDEFPPYLIRKGSREFVLHDEVIELSELEFKLAEYMFRHGGRLLSRRHLLEAVWGTSSDLATRTVDIHISKVRRKLKIGAENAWKLGSVYKIGYRGSR